MNRRTFVYTTSLMVTAGSIYSSIDSKSKSEIKRPNPALFKKPVMKGIAYGVNAPNPHNTQAWKFQLLSDTEMLLFVDEQKILPATDPTTRQIHIGCGCFLACMRLGMQQIGYSSQIELFPNGTYGIVDIGQQPIAKITFKQKANQTIDSLGNFINKRSTSRLKYKGEGVSEVAFKEILKKANPLYSNIQLIQQSTTLEKILPIIYEGMEVETYTYRTHDESRKWFRQNDELIREKRDGINLPGGGTTGFTKWIAEKQLKDLNPKKWHNEKANAIFLKNHKAKVLSSKGIIVLQTANNDFLDWVKAGQDYLHLQLACTEKGYYMHPLSQVLQEFEEMTPLRTQFETMMKVQAPSKIQMVVRVGKSKMPFKSYRRNVQDFIGKKGGKTS